MKAIIFNLIALLGWVILGRFFPAINLLGAFIFFPIIFVLTEIFVKYNLSGYVVVPFCFFVVFLGDYFFRLCGGGIHDDAGRAWATVTFYITLPTTVSAMMFIMYSYFKRSNSDKIMLVQWVKSITYVIFICLAFLIIFHKTAIHV
jgi:hypothetical protein